MIKDYLPPCKFKCKFMLSYFEFFIDLILFCFLHQFQYPMQYILQYWYVIKIFLILGICAAFSFGLILFDAIFAEVYIFYIHSEIFNYIILVHVLAFVDQCPWELLYTDDFVLVAESMLVVIMSMGVVVS